MTGWKVLMLNLLQKDAWLHEKKHSLYFGVQTAVHVHGNVKEKNRKIPMSGNFEY